MFDYARANSLGLYMHPDDTDWDTVLKRADIDCTVSRLTDIVKSALERVRGPC